MKLWWKFQIKTESQLEIQPSGSVKHPVFFFFFVFWRDRASHTRFVNSALSKSTASLKQAWSSRSAWLYGSSPCTGDRSYLQGQPCSKINFQCAHAWKRANGFLLMDRIGFSRTRGFDGDGDGQEMQRSNWMPSRIPGCSNWLEVRSRPPREERRGAPVALRQSDMQHQQELSLLCTACCWRTIPQHKNSCIELQAWYNWVSMLSINIINYWFTNRPIQYSWAPWYMLPVVRIRSNYVIL